MPLLVRRKNLIPVFYSQFGVANVAVGFDKLVPIPTDAKKVLLQVSTKPLRWRDDGVDPTDLIGNLVAADSDPFLYEGNDLSAFKMIRVGITNAIIRFSFYK